MHLKFITNIRKKNILQEKIEKLFKAKEDIDFDIWIKFLRDNAESTFATIIDTKKSIYSAVDKASKIPIFFCLKSYQVSTNLNDLLKSENHQEIEESQAVLTFFSGYTLGKKTIYKNIQILQPGQCLIVDKVNKKFKIENYFDVSKIKKLTLDNDILHNNFKDLLFDTFKKIKDLQRPIYVPLSAGKDSRLIVSMLRELNVRNVNIFSYGKNRNFEVQTAKNISEKLNFNWKYFPLNKKIQKKSILSSDFKEFSKKYESAFSIPFRQDFAVIHQNRNFFHRDGLIINGNTGDFITGGHMPVLHEDENELNENKLINYIISKHYTLWNFFSDQEYKKIFLLVKNEIKDINLSSDLNSFDIYQIFEFYNRQAKFVINGQRIYDFFELEWDLPFWSDSFIKFWFGVPTKHKSKQNFYIDFLNKENLGGVWKDFKDYKQQNSFDIRFLQSILRFFNFLLHGGNEEKWLRTKRRLIEPLIDHYGHYFNYPYFKICFSQNYPRNAIAWHTHEYLKEKKILIRKIVND